MGDWTGQGDRKLKEGGVMDRGRRRRGEEWEHTFFFLKNHEIFESFLSILHH